MEKLSYEEAVAELNNIVKQLEDPKIDISDLKGLIIRANELVSFCKKELIGHEAELTSLLEEK